MASQPNCRYSKLELSTPPPQKILGTVPVILLNEGEIPNKSKSVSQVQEKDHTINFVECPTEAFFHIRLTKQIIS